MNAHVKPQASGIEPLRLTLPEPALTWLHVCLGQAIATGEALAACAAYGTDWGALRDLLAYFASGFELAQQRLFGLPLFETWIRAERWCFLHARSEEESARPLLLLHGYSASLAEFQDHALPLTRASGCAFHVICPSLPGFGLTSGPPCPREAATACAALMERLGYTRYLVHGSDLGAKIALELAALDGERVAALHVTSAPAYPSCEATELTSDEKSQLALLDELCLEPAADGPLQELAATLSRLDYELGSPSDALKDALLMGLLLSWLFGSSSARDELRKARIHQAPRSTVPLALHAFPLDMPSLKRFSSARYRVAEWQAHERGGSMPALEQPELWLGSLQRWARNVA